MSGMIAGRNRDFGFFNWNFLIGLFRKCTAVQLVLLLSLSVLSGCPNNPPPRPQPQQPVAAAPTPLAHQVKYSGETLGVIARWYTGKSSNWTFVAAANPGLNPNRISLGDTILVPQELLVRNDPMPRSAIGAASASRPAAVEPSGDSPVAVEPAGSLDVIPAEAVNATPPPVPAKPSGDVSVDDLLKELEANQKEVEQAPPSVTAPPVANPDSGKTLGEKERDALLDELLSQ